MREEAQDGLDRDILVPARIETVRPPIGFRMIQTADLVDWEGDPAHSGFAQLVEDITGVLSEHPPQERVPEPEAESEMSAKPKAELEAKRVVDPKDLPDLAACQAVEEQQQDAQQREQGEARRVAEAAAKRETEAKRRADNEERQRRQHQDAKQSNGLRQIWDEGQIFDYLVDEFSREQGIDLRNDRVALQHLKEAAKKAKVELSSTMQTEVSLPFTMYDGKRFFPRPNHLNITLTRTKLEALEKTESEAKPGNLTKEAQEPKAEKVIDPKGRPTLAIFFKNWSRRGHPSLPPQPVLPTPPEVEWEYTARAGTTTRYAFGDVIGKQNANYYYVGKTTDVGVYPANPWLLYDMHGNVWEWVEDIWHDSYEGAPADGTAWTDFEGKDDIILPRTRNVRQEIIYDVCMWSPESFRVLRGGSWFSSPWFLRSAMRNWIHPFTRDSDIGFRIARTLDSRVTLSVKRFPYDTAALSTGRTFPLS